MARKLLLLLVAGLCTTALTLASAQGLPKTRLAPGGIRAADATSTGKKIVPQPAIKPGKHPGRLQAGGPDGAGYRYKDEREGGGPTYSWYDATTGTNSGIYGDDSYGTVSMPFTFNWYGTGYSVCYPCTNGFIGLNTYGTSYTEYALPTTYLPAVTVAPYWDDLYVGGSGAENIYYKTFGSSPNQVFVVEYDSDYTLSGSYFVTFEVCFNQADMSCTFQYKQMDANAQGQSATVGEQAAQSGSNYLQYSYDQQSLANGRAIKFYPPVSETLDIGCTAIPVPNGDSGTYSPTATIHEWGSQRVNSFSARFLATGPGTTYDQTLTGLHMAASSDTTLTFPSGHFAPEGNWTLSCSTALSGDQTPANDKFTTVRNLNNTFKVMIDAAEYMSSYPYLQAAIRDSSGGLISRADTMSAQTYYLRRPDSLLAAGYKVILTFADYSYISNTAEGDTLAKFMELGGGVVMMVFGDEMIAGRYSTQYMPIPVTSDYYGSLSLGWKDTLHPIMQGITSLTSGEYNGGATALRNDTCCHIVGKWNNNNIECATFDSSGIRTAYIGFLPVQEIGNYLSGKWVRQIENAILWTIPPPPTPRVSMRSPLAGANWQVGVNHTIRWSSKLSLHDSVWVTADSGGTWTFLKDTVPTDTATQFTWTVPNTPSARCYVMVKSINSVGTTIVQSGKFNIVSAPTVSSVVPAGGEFWEYGVVHHVTWSSTGDVKDSLVYSTDNGSTWAFMANDSPPHRNYAWTVPNHVSAHCLVKVFAMCDPLATPVSAQSANQFNIVGPPTVTSVQPSGGISWQVGITHSITWASTGDMKDSLLYSTNSGSNWTFLATDSPPHHTYAWVVPNHPSATCLVKVVAIGDPLAPPVSGQSPSVFSIVVAPTVSSVVPAGGETWEELITHNITWASTGDIKDSLVYSTDAGTSWAFIGKVTPPGGRSYAWSVPNAPSTTCLVKVFAISLDPLGPISGQSANNFTIAPTPTITALYPNGGVVWVIGSHHTLTWLSANSHTDSLSFTRDGVTWVYMGRQSPPVDSFIWNVPGPACTTCLVKVQSMSGDPLAPPESTISSSYFDIIAAPNVSVSSPNGGENWQALQTYNITWTSSASNTDSIVWSTDNGATWSFVAKQSTPISHSYAWTVPGVYGNQNLIKVFAIGWEGYTVSDQSNGTFTILTQSGGWTMMPSVPAGAKNKTVKDGAALAYGLEPQTTEANDTGYVYAFKGNGTYEFYRYNTKSTAWIPRDSIPAIGHSGKKKPVKKGGALIVGGDGKVYGTKGNGTYEFWCYDPSRPASQHWLELPDVPLGAKALKEGTGLAAVSISGTNYIYLLKGSGTQEFYRYNTSDSLWETMANALPGASNKPYKYGSSITYDGNDTIWCLKGSYDDFAAYSVSANTWVTKSPLPLIAPPSTKKTKVKDGSQIAYGNRVVYAVKGDNTNEFWTFKCGAQNWILSDVVPAGAKKVKGGGALVVAKNVSSLFALRGNGTLEFWKYGPIGAYEFTPEVGNELKSDIQGQATARASRFALSITPNPFTSSRNASISYSLPRAGDVSLRLYDVTGQLVTTVAQGYTLAGSHTAPLDATGLARGIYLLKYESESGTTTTKLIIE